MRGFMIAGTIISGIAALVFGVIAWLLVAFAFDRPGSEYDYWTWALVVLMRGIVVAAILGLLGSWLAYILNRPLTAAASMTLPAPIWVAAFSVGLIVLTAYCGEALACPWWAPR